MALLCEVRTEKGTWGALESDKKFLQLKTFIILKRTKCSKILYREKRKGWRKFVGSFDSKILTSEIWSLIRAFKRCNLTLPNYIVDPSKER